MSPQERIAELEEQVAFYKSELGLADHATRTAILSERLGCTAGGASILMQLYDANGRVLSGWVLNENLPRRDIGRPRKDCENSISVMICYLRRRAGRAAIKTHWGAGYSITAEGRTVVERALARQAARDAA